MSNQQDSNKFTPKIKIQREKFDQLLHKFNTHDDPVTRFIIRERLRKIGEELSDNGIYLDIP
jgi:PIN domain nuclease of toxin-antitoxin system